MAHTPGPWAVRPFDESQARIMPSARDGRQPLIAIISIGYARPDGEDNARLIAAAPELLALVRLLAADTTTYGGQLGSRTLAARALLARIDARPEPVAL